MSSGQGEIPDRRYSPQARKRRNRCDSGTDSIVWMEEDFDAGTPAFNGVHLEGMAFQVFTFEREVFCYEFMGAIG